MIFASSLHRPLASRAGYTMIEVLVSIGIFSVAVLGLAAGAITVTRANKTSHFHTMATNLAQDKLEHLKAATPANVNTCSSNCDASAPTYQGVSFTRTWVVTAVGGTKQIDVTVQWRDYADKSLTVTSSVLQ